MTTEIKYPARIVKHGDGLYVKVGRETQDLLDLERNDYVMVTVTPIDAKRPRRDSNPVSEFWEDYEGFPPRDRNQAVDDAINSQARALTA